MDATELPENLELSELIVWALYGDPRIAELGAIESCQLVLLGRRRITVDRSTSSGASLSIGAKSSRKNVECVGLELFGLDESDFREAAFWDARFAMLEGSEEALTAFLRQACHLDEQEYAKKYETLIRQREDLQRASANCQPPTISDPPALGGLMQSIHDERQMVKDLLDERIEGAARIKQVSQSTRPSPLMPSLANEMEEGARRLKSIGHLGQKIEEQAGSSRIQEIVRGLFIAAAAIGISAGLTGRALSDPSLVSIAWWMMASAAPLAFAAVLQNVAASSRRLRLSRELARQKSRVEEGLRRVALRMGEMLPDDELTPLLIHAAIDRAMQRYHAADVSRTLSAIKAPDTSLVATQRLRGELDSDPLAGALVMPQDGAPAISAISYNARRLVSDWAKALREPHEGLIKYCPERATIDLETELIESALKNVQQDGKVPSDRKRQARKGIEFSVAWNRQVISSLRSLLGNSYPVAFGRDLSVEWNGDPTSESTTTTARWMGATGRLQLPQWRGSAFAMAVVDIDSGLRESTADRLIANTLTQPLSQRPWLIFRTKTAVKRLNDVGHGSWCAAIQCELPEIADDTHETVAVGPPPTSDCLVRD